ncbi:hypothetical protein IJJ18_02430 [Candidatus Saccharibacteria bacterium]|nr:hypothetical protein [Candidatus Saccharibacteria bacterium]
MSTSKQKAKKPVYKCWWFWTIIGAAVATIAIVLFLILKGPSFAKTDINGLSIDKACEEVRKNGWDVLDVRNGNNEDEYSNCRNTDNKVVAYVYRDNVQKVSIWYDGEKPEKDEKTEQKEETTTKETTTTTSTPASTTTSTSSPSSNWKQILSDYEAWVDQYVAFMQKYKNASASDMTSMYNDYIKLTGQISDWTTKLNNAQGSLSGSNLTEYLNTLNRINAKMASVN